MDGKGKINGKGIGVKKYRTHSPTYLMYVTKNRPERIRRTVIFLKKEETLFSR